MAATIAAAVATTSHIVPFGKPSSSTIPTTNPAAITTPPASTSPSRPRRVLTLSDARHQGSPHSIDVGGVDSLRRHEHRLHMGCPRPPGEVVGREEDGRPHTDRGGEMADSRVVPQIC